MMSRHCTADQKWTRNTLLLLMLVLTACSSGGNEPLKIGVLHSLSGAMAGSEVPMVDAVQLAVEELNQQGGVLGRRVEMVVGNTRSDPDVAAQEAERLIGEEGVEVLFGCWTSICRKTVKKVVEQRQHLLFYPLQYEGLERSPHIIYTGSVPNQQIIPALRWSMDHIGKRFYLVGSDYIFPRQANQLIKELALSQGAELLGERYLPLGSNETTSIVEEIAALRPDVVFNTINGDTNYAFFDALRQAGLTGDRIPVLSFSIAEVELSRQPDLMMGHYAVWSYFQSIDTPRNRAFVAAFRKRFGPKRVVDDPMEATYLGVLLWAQGVQEAQNATPNKVISSILRQSLDAPQGIVSLDRASHHLWRTVRIGRARVDGQFDIVWSSERPIRPQPFPYWHENWSAASHADFLSTRGQP
ncbi:MAG: urea ABC transporter substrate-binding protein [Magnetococcus sp. DMHC-6]